MTRLASYCQPASRRRHLDAYPDSIVGIFCVRDAAKHAGHCMSACPWVPWQQGLHSMKAAQQRPEGVVDQMNLAFQSES